MTCSDIFDKTDILIYTQKTKHKHYPSTNHLLARPKLENEDPARARPVEGGKPGLSGLVCPVAGADRSQTKTMLRLAALAARDGGFGARSGTKPGFDAELRLQNSIRCSAVGVLAHRVVKCSQNQAGR